MKTLILFLISLSVYTQTVSEDRAHEIFDSLVQTAEKFSIVDPYNIFFMPDHEEEDVGRAQASGMYYNLIVGKKALVSEDILALVICHELGHIYGKSPHNEGMADYYAVKNCLLKSKVVSAIELPHIFVKSLNILEDGPIAIENYDRSVCKKMSDDHPTKQQRLDTYMNALNGKTPPKSWYCP